MAESELKDHTVDTYWIGWTSPEEGEDVIHYGCSPVGSIVSSGQKNMESFTEEQDCIDRLIELGVTAENIEF